MCLALFALETVLLATIQVGSDLLEDGADEGGAAAHGILVPVGSRVSKYPQFIEVRFCFGKLFWC